MSTGTFYDLRVYWDSTSDEWLYTDSGCSIAIALTLSYETTNAEAKISATAYGFPSADFFESTDTTATHFSADAAYVTFDPSLMYMVSGYTWYSATVWAHQYELDALTGSGAPGVDYSCYSFGRN